MRAFEITQVITKGRAAATVASLLLLGTGLQTCPLARYLERDTSMIFTTKVAKAMQSIAIISAFEISIVITSCSRRDWA